MTIHKLSGGKTITQLTISFSLGWALDCMRCENYLFLLLTTLFVYPRVLTRPLPIPSLCTRHTLHCTFSITIYQTHAIYQISHHYLSDTRYSSDLPSLFIRHTLHFTRSSFQSGSSFHIFSYPSHTHTHFSVLCTTTPLSM